VKGKGCAGHTVSVEGLQDRSLSVPRFLPRWPWSRGCRATHGRCGVLPRRRREDPAACRVGSEGLKQRGRQPIRRGVRGGSPALQLRALQIRRSRRIVQGRPLRAVRWAQHSRAVRTCQALSGGLATVLSTAAALAASIATVRFSGRAKAQLGDEVQAWRSVAGCHWLALVAAVAVTIAARLTTRP
jgi:hypothetical protein